MQDSTSFNKVHHSPVLDFDWNNSLLVSGDKNGKVVFWDVNTASVVREGDYHKGGVGVCKLYSDGLNNSIIISTGLNDGMVYFYDMRTNEPIFAQQLHKGSINTLLVITGSADKTLKIIDIPSGFKILGNLICKDCVFSSETFENLTIAGCADGNILVFDNDSQECLYGFGVMKKGIVRCLQTTQDKSKLIVAGDDPSAVILNYS